MPLPRGTRDPTLAGVEDVQGGRGRLTILEGAGSYAGWSAYVLLGEGEESTAVLNPSSVPAVPDASHAE